MLKNNQKIQLKKTKSKIFHHKMMLIKRKLVKMVFAIAMQLQVF